MKIYETAIQIPYITQDHFRVKFDHIINDHLSVLGASLLTQVYKDLPQCFTQENNHYSQNTTYKVKLAILDRTEYEIALRESRTLRERHQRNLTNGE